MITTWYFEKMIYKLMIIIVFHKKYWDISHLSQLNMLAHISMK